LNVTQNIRIAIGEFEWNTEGEIIYIKVDFAGGMRMAIKNSGEFVNIHGNLIGKLIFE
jgi:hypothetical protein